MSSRDIGADPVTWEEEYVKQVEHPFFRLATKLGSGENASVYAIGYYEHEVWYSSDSDAESEQEGSDSAYSPRSSHSGYSHESDSSRGQRSSSSECSYEYGEEEELVEEEGKTQRREDVNMVDIDVEHEGGVQQNLPIPDDMTKRRVHRDTPMGTTQLVCKVFKHLDESVCYAIYEKVRGSLIIVLGDEEECEDYIRRRRMKRGNYDVRLTRRHFTAPTEERMGTAKLLEFPNESLVNIFLTKLLANTQITPHITMAFDAFTYKNNGLLLMERLDCTLDDILNVEEIERAVRKGMASPLFTVTELCSLFFQSLFGLVVAQRACKLKHHDLHSGNVFLKRITDDTTFRNAKLSEATTFHYHLDGTDFYLPNSGFVAKLGDFGMSSMDIQNHRLQRIDMDLFNDDPEKWGGWNAEYEGERGYDAQVLFADVPVDGRHRSCSELHHFLKHVRTSTSGKKGRVTKKKARPMPGHVSNLPADSILRAIFVRNVRSAYNFLDAPPQGNQVVITLGDSRWEP